MKSPVRPQRLTDRQESPGRIEALTDGIFSVAMTLLVLGLAVGAHERTAQTANADLWRALVDGTIGWKFLWFLASFVVTSFFWLGHVLIFWTIDRINRVVIWLNIMFFVPIVLVPFTTQIVGEFPHARLAGVFYMLDILAASLTIDSVWFYSARKRLIAERTPRDVERAISRRLAVITSLIVVASVVAPFFPYYAIGAMLLALLYVVLTTGTRLLVD
jgi:uncharacterized membrane protein